MTTATPTKPAAIATGLPDVGVYVACLIRYCRTPPQLRARRRRIEQSSRLQFWQKCERETVELLRRRGLIDTPENRARLRR